MNLAQIFMGGEFDKSGMSRTIVAAKPKVDIVDIRERFVVLPADMAAVPSDMFHEKLAVSHISCYTVHASWRSLRWFCCNVTMLDGLSRFSSSPIQYILQSCIYRFHQPML